MTAFSHEEACRCGRCLQHQIARLEAELDEAREDYKNSGDAFERQVKRWEEAEAEAETAQAALSTLRAEVEAVAKQMAAHPRGRCSTPEECIGNWAVILEDTLAAARGEPARKETDE